LQRNRRGLPDTVAAFSSQGATIQGVTRHVLYAGPQQICGSCLIVNTLCLEDSVWLHWRRVVG